LILLINIDAKMKRIVKIAVAAIPVILFTTSVLNAQEKEKHLKIVVIDNTGNKTKLDTLIKGDMNSDSIKLKNGETIYLSSMGNPGKTMRHESSGTMIVAHSSNDKNSNDKQKKVIIITDAGDSSKVIEGSDVIIVKGGKHIVSDGGDGGDGYAVFTSKDGSSGSKYVYIDESKSTGDKKEKTIEFSYTTDKKGNSNEKSKYVIAKDGIVVTVEGDDEVKAKEIIEDVKAKLGVNKEDKSGKENAKETKKTKKE
jgi:hypothetical protein